MPIRSARVAILTTIVAIAALLGGQGGAQAAPGDIGVRYGWGYNFSGAVGIGIWDDTNVPVRGSLGAVPTGQLFTDVAVSENSSDAFACGIASGQAYCWGDNSYGQLGANSLDDSSPLPVAVSTSGALSGKTLISVSAGRGFACALDSDGRAYCWGRNNSGQLGDGSASGGLSRVPVAVSTTGALAGTSLTQISSGNEHTCVLDDTIYCWGANVAGQLGDSSTLNKDVPVAVTMTSIPGGRASAIGVGWDSSCALSATGSAYCWGNNDIGQLGNGTWGAGNNASTPTAVSTAGVLGGRTLEGISINRRSACAWDDSVYCWGDNGNGQLGVGSQPPWESFTPVAVSTTGALAGKDIELVSVGSYSVCALDSAGAAYCWGAPWNGRLGIGPAAADQLAPAAVAGGHTFATLSVGDGTVGAVAPATATVTYDANQATSGSPPAAGTGTINSTFTVAGNTGSLARSGYSFVGWNTNDQGAGTSYAAGTGTFTLTGDITLYAQWQALAPPPPPPPPPQPPQPPRLLTAAPGNAQVTLTWARPDWEGSTPVTEYRVFTSPGGQACVTAQLTCTATGLVNGQPYEFWVTAANSIGESAPSQRLTATPRANPPAPPVLTSVTARDRSAVITWEPPESDGGAPITAYRVTSSTGVTVCEVDAGPPHTCTAEGLVNDRYYSFWVTAVNSAGESPRSNIMGVKVAPALPGKPRDVEGTAGDKRIYVAWRPPEDDGDAPVDRYEVALVGAGRTCVVDESETACTVTGLTPGRTYIARVRARSSVGWGPWAFSQAILVPPNPPKGIAVTVRRLPKDPDLVVVTGRTTGISPGTALWVWIHRMTDEGYMQSFQGSSRPVVKADGTFTWERKAPANRVWEVIWCTEPNVQGICSRWTLLVDYENFLQVTSLDLTSIHAT